MMSTGADTAFKVHWLTPEKGVHQFRYFLPMNTILLSAHACMHFYGKWIQCLRHHTSVYALNPIPIKMHVHEQTTIELGISIVGRKNLNWCNGTLFLV